MKPGRLLLGSVAIIALHVLLVAAIAVLNRSESAPPSRDVEIALPLRLLDPPTPPEPPREPDEPIAAPELPRVVRELPELSAAIAASDALAPPPLDVPGIGALPLDIERIPLVSAETAVAGVDARAAATSRESQASEAASGEARVDTPPRALPGNAQPGYPTLARRRGWSGTVGVRLLIDESGRVREARVEDPDVHAIFRDVVLDAVREWRFEPARLEGEPVAAWITQVFRFEMNER